MNDRFLVYETDDPFYAAICIGFAEAQKIARDIGYNSPTLRIMRITDGELCRDVTRDFLNDILEAQGIFCIEHDETETHIGVW